MTHICKQSFLYCRGIRLFGNVKQEQVGQARAPTQVGDGGDADQDARMDVGHIGITEPKGCVIQL